MRSRKKFKVYRRDEVTVQGALESALWHTLKPAHHVKLSTSCRTDVGVHALHNTGTCDLLPGSNSGLYPSPRAVTKAANAYLGKKNFDIRVTRTLGVPASFHCRYDVLTRSYLFKLAIFPQHDQVIDQRFHPFIPARPDVIMNKTRSRALLSRNRCVGHLLSMSETDKVYNYHLRKGQSFDLQLFKESLKLMEGTHNFSNFSKATGLYKFKTVNGKRYTKIPRTEDEKIRVINFIDVIERPPPLPESVFPLYHDNNVLFLDIVIKGEAFLYNQVRRMVGAAIAVASGKCDLGYLSDLISDPDKGWDGGLITPAGARGLYLARVDYKPGALDQATEVMEEMMKLEKVVYDPNHGHHDEEQCEESDTSESSDCDDNNRGPS